MRKLGLLSWIFLPFLPALGCPTLPEAIPCGTIPEGGCPLGRGGTCADTYCSALYDCVDGAWVSAKVCSTSDAGVPDGGLPDGGSTDGGACTPIGVDLSGEQIDCTPDLELPDCVIEAAFPCVETACTTGCVDFYLCTSAGWTAVAYCDEQHGFIAGP